MEVIYQLSDKEWQKYRPEDAFYMRRPRIINLLQWDGEKFVYPPQMKYFKKPRRTAYPLNLNKNRELHVFRNFFGYYDLDFIEEHIMHNNFTFDDPDSIEKIKICTTRGLLMDLMKMPNRGFLKDFTFYATKYDGIIYLRKHYTEDRLFNDNDTHHYKLQQYCLADKPNEEPDMERGFDEHKDLVAIYRNQLKNFDILYSSRICGIDAADAIPDMADFDDINKRKFVMTKVLRENCNWKTNFRLLNFWVQAYLAHITELHFGFKDDNALVNRPLTQVLVKDLPKMKKFQPHICMQFLHKILTMVDAKTSTINCPRTVCQFQFDLEKRCLMYKLHKGKTEFSFLTDQFIKYVENRK